MTLLVQTGEYGVDYHRHMPKSLWNHMIKTYPAQFLTERQKVNKTLKSTQILKEFLKFDAIDEPTNLCVIEMYNHGPLPVNRVAFYLMMGTFIRKIFLELNH